MIIRRSFAGTVLLGVAVLGLGGCGDGDNKPGGDRAEVRYRMSVEVETPDGVKSGSSVWSRSIRKSIGPISPYNAGFKAEAVAVDLADGRTIFALVKGQEGMVDAFYPELAVYQENGENDRVAHVAAISSSRATKTLPCTPEAREAWPHKNPSFEENYDNYCPMLVTFKDLRDPTSVARVDPDDLAASFGAGYRLKTITVQVTDEPVTVGIEGRLGWLGKYPEPRLQDIPQGGTTTPTFAQSIEHGDFKRIPIK